MDLLISVRDQSNRSGLCIMCCWKLFLFYGVNSSPHGQKGCHFRGDIFRCIFMNEKFSILIEISLKFVPKDPNDNKPALIQIMAWRRIGDKPLSEPMMVNLLMHLHASLGHDELTPSSAGPRCMPDFHLVITCQPMSYYWSNGARSSPGTVLTTKIICCLSNFHVYQWFCIPFVGGMMAIKVVDESSTNPHSTEMRW